MDLIEFETEWRGFGRFYKVAVTEIPSGKDGYMSFNLKFEESYSDDYLNVDLDVSLDDFLFDSLKITDLEKYFILDPELKHSNECGPLKCAWTGKEAFSNLCAEIHQLVLKKKIYNAIGEKPLETQKRKI